jgi:hypothetical protein
MSTRLRGSSPPRRELQRILRRATAHSLSLGLDGAQSLHGHGTKEWPDAAGSPDGRKWSKRGPLRPLGLANSSSKRRRSGLASPISRKKARKCVSFPICSRPVVLSFCVVTPTDGIFLLLMCSRPALCSHIQSIVPSVFHFSLSAPSFLLYLSHPFLVANLADRPFAPLPPRSECRPLSRLYPSAN